MTYQAPTLACTAPHCIYFFGIPLTTSCWHNPKNSEWNAAPLAWLTPRPAPERVCLLWLLDMSTAPPPFTQFVQKGWQSTGLELRILMVYEKFRGSGPEIIWRTPPQKKKIHRGTTPSPIRPIYIPIDKSRRQDSKYIFLIGERHAVQELCFLRPPDPP